MKRLITFVFLLFLSSQLFSNCVLHEIKLIAANCVWHETPLMLAAAKGDTGQVAKLIEQGADVRAVAFCDQPHAGNPVLRYAIDSHCVRTIALLIEAGAPIHVFTESPLLTGNKKSNVRNLSLLCHAIRSKAPISVIELLLQCGAHVDGSPRIWSDWSALMIAAYTGYAQAVEVLLAAGADKDAVNSMDGKTAFDYAQEQGHAKIINLLQG